MKAKSKGINKLRKQEQTIHLLKMLLKAKKKKKQYKHIRKLLVEKPSYCYTIIFLKIIQGIKKARQHPTFPLDQQYHRRKRA